MIPFHALALRCFALTALIAVAPPALAGVNVPLNQCLSRCAGVIDVNPACISSLANATCIRIDFPARIISRGRPWFSAAYIQCSNCCKFTPADCPGNDAIPATMHCTLSTGLTFLAGVWPALSPDIFYDVGTVPAQLEATLQPSLPSVVNLQCMLAADKCRSQGSIASIRGIIGQTSAIQHTWRAQGSWAGAGCPIAGKTWIVGGLYCRIAQSTASADILLEATCGTPFPAKCYDPIPCP